MKAQCERCKEIVPLDFEAAPDGIRVKCPSCAESYFVPATVKAAPPPKPPEPKPAVTFTTRAQTAPPVAASKTCPKCGEGRPPEAASCRRCGLVFAKWRGVASAADASEIPLENAQRAKGLWDLVEAGWDEQARHDAFLGYCRESGAYAYAAGRYRAAMSTRPDDPRAKAGLDKVRQLAEQALARLPRVEGASGAAGRKTTPLARTLALVGFLVLLVVAGAVLLNFMGRSGQHHGPRKPPAHAS